MEQKYLKLNKRKGIGVGAQGEGVTVYIKVSSHEVQKYLVLDWSKTKQTANSQQIWPCSAPCCNDGRWVNPAVESNYSTPGRK